MKYLQKSFSVAVGGSDNYDNVFGKKCFYCRQLIEEGSPDWELGAHEQCEKKVISETD